MKTYGIRVRGCDDSTEFNINLSDDEAATITMIANISQNLGGGCNATLHIGEPIVRETYFDGDETEQPPLYDDRDLTEEDKADYRWYN